MIKSNSFTGVERTFYTNSFTLKSEVYILNGKKNGIYRSFHENGQIYEESNYLDGKLNGIKNTYNKNGNIESECIYIDGKENGIYKEYRITGELWYEINFLNGITSDKTCFTSAPPIPLFLNSGKTENRSSFIPLSV